MNRKLLPPKCVLCNRVMVFEDRVIVRWKCLDHEVYYLENQRQYVSSNRCPKCDFPYNIEFDLLICPSCGNTDLIL